MKPPLTAARGKRGVRSIAEATGCNTGTLWRYENGVVIPKPETAEKLAPEYGISPDEVREYAKIAHEMRKKAERRKAAATAS